MKDFSDMKWGIWWFIDTKYSQEQKTLAQKNWEKLGNYSGYSKAEMSNGTLTVNDLVTGKVTIFSGSDFLDYVVVLSKLRKILYILKF